MKMMGTYYLGNKKFETRELTDLTPGEGEVRVRVAACGVCGTDVHIYHGSKGSAEVTPPVILGHEFSGVVEEVGPNVDAVKVGDHVTVDPNMYCGKCYYCRRGKKQLCDNLQAYGVNRNGGFSDACVVKQEQCYLLAPELPLEYGAMAEPLACALHGIDRCNIRTGDSVCVIGGGAIGMLMVQLAKLSGATCVIISEPVEKRREIALQLGADAAVDPINEDLAARVKEITGNDGVDVAIECVGNRIAVRQAFEICAKGATIVTFAVHPVDEIDELSPFEIYSKELTMTGSMINPDTHSRAADMISSGRIQLAPILTHRFPIDKLEEAILAQMGNESIKVLVVPENA